MKSYSTQIETVIAESNTKMQSLYRGLAIYHDTAEYYEIPSEFKNVFKELGWGNKVYEGGEVDEEELELDLSQDSVVMKTIEWLDTQDAWKLHKIGYLDNRYFWSLWDRAPMKESFQDYPDKWMHPLSKSPELQRIFWRHWNTWRKQDDSVESFYRLGFTVAAMGKAFDPYMQKLLANKTAVAECNPDTLYHDLTYELDNSDFYYELEELHEGSQLAEDQINFLLDKAKGHDWKRAQRTMNKWDEANGFGWTPKQGLDRFFTLMSDDVDAVLQHVKELRNDWVHKQAPTIPEFKMEYADWVVRTLDLSQDAEIILGLTIGDFTGCCQKVGSGASSSAVYSVSHHDSNVLVAELNGEIYGQSWMWTHEDKLVLDNLEIKACSKETRGEITQAWMAAARRLGRATSKSVYLGINNGDQFMSLAHYDIVDMKSFAPKNCYTDSERAIQIA